MNLKPTYKKRLIAALLLVSCLVSSFMLVRPAGENRTLSNFAEADSLIMENFSRFNIPRDQIRSFDVEVDSSFARKNYYASLPQGFSKTQLHATLNRSLHYYNISTPAEVELPSGDMVIHIVYNNTVIRSISLRTDPDLMLHRYPASVVVTAEEVSDNLLSSLVNFGEPIALTLVNDNLRRLEDEYAEAAQEYNRIYFRIMSDGGDDLLDLDDTRHIQQQLNSLISFRPGATLLTFSSPGETLTRFIRQSRLSVIEASERIEVESGDNERELRRKLEQFKQAAVEGNKPILILPRDPEILESLKPLLIELKTEGLYLVPPSSEN